MKKTTLLGVLTLGASLLSSGSAGASDFWDLSFSDHADIPANSWQPTPSATVGDQYTTLSTLYFFNAAPDADSGSWLNIKVTATSYITNGHGNAYSYNGSFPDYRKAGTGEPDGDLGFYYQYNNAGRGGATNSNPAVGGVRYTFEFFQGDYGDRNIETAFLAVYEVPSLRLLIYDVDSDANQVESVRAYVDEGFYAYYVAKVKPLLVSEQTVGDREAFLFTHDGSGDQLETDASGATVLLFSNTSKFTLELEASTRSNSTNGVFGAIDGDLSLIGGDLSDFEYVVVVPDVIPEPSSMVLMGGAVAGMALMALRRRR